MMNPSDPLALILMGVSGSGKTAVGKLLSRELGWPFFDGDDFHPPENIDKMAKDIPLDDKDREPWLETLNNLIHQNLNSGYCIILACSALKQEYRNRLKRGNPNTIFVYLKGEFDLIFSRMKKRPGHYMKANMLQSQFEAMEEPEDALVVDIKKNLDSISKEIMEYLESSGRIELL